MKSATFKVEFTSHVLANAVGPNGERDSFQRSSDRKLVFNQSWFYSAFRSALEFREIHDVKPGDINMDLRIEAKTEPYRRRYIGPDGQPAFRVHEAIPPGTEVEMAAMVDARVTQSILEDILNTMGTFIGLSPYGYNLGFGRFRVISVEVAHSEPHPATSDAQVDAAPGSDT